MRTSHHQRDEYFISMCRRRIVDNGIDLYQCFICKEYKETNDFYINNSNKCGVHSYCIECVKISRNIEKKDIESTTNDNVKDNAIEILKNLGYDMDSTISEQFNNRIKEKYGVILN